MGRRRNPELRQINLQDAPDRVSRWRLVYPEKADGSPDFGYLPTLVLRGHNVKVIYNDSTGQWELVMRNRWQAEFRAGTSDKAMIRVAGLVSEYLADLALETYLVDHFNTNWRAQRAALRKQRQQRRKKIAG